MVRMKIVKYTTLFSHTYVVNSRGDLAENNSETDNLEGYDKHVNIIGLSCVPTLHQMRADSILRETANVEKTFLASFDAARVTPASAVLRDESVSRERER